MNINFSTPIPNDYPVSFTISHLDNGAVSVKISEIGTGNKVSVSDGYHTFDELYEHRIELFIALCGSISKRAVLDRDHNPVWKSIYHSDKTNYDGWFLLGIFKEKGKQITYHLPMIYWERCYMAETVEKAPEWDGHTSADVLERLKTI